MNSRPLALPIPERHIMRLESEQPDIWYCPMCGRRIEWISYNPIQRNVLAEGDSYAIHSGGKNGISMGMVEIKESDGLSPELRAVLEQALYDIEID